MRKTTMSWIKALPLLLLTAGPLVSSAPAKTSESKPVDRLVAAAQSALQQAKQNSSVAQDHDLNLGRHKGDSFTSPVDGYFIQERASRGLPEPGQHKNYGALVPWDQIVSKVNAETKLLFLIRHGQAWSNYLEEVLGPDLWYGVVSKCGFTTGNGTDYQIFDAELTDVGQAQAENLHTLLASNSSFKTVTGGLPTRAVVSPLSRCLDTASIVLADMQLTNVNTEELIRETLGSDTCDARRSVSDPPGGGKPETGPCAFDRGLKSKYPTYDFPVLGKDKTELGLLTDDDHLWKKNKREKQKDQIKRAETFLETLFNNAEEQVIFVVTHSGFIRSLLLAVDREPYRPKNAEVVPALIRRRQRQSS
uniref:Putative extracellular protein TR9_040 n=1 Tax=Trebouxia lynnae TaxID=1825957 RepID=A0A7L9QEG9_9CHLO|nr:putative extracellular protein TR9_040 [Trebouxia lynnae]